MDKREEESNKLRLALEEGFMGDTSGAMDWEAFSQTTRDAYMHMRDKAAEMFGADNARLQSENAALREALEASGDTKAAYSGEFKMPITISGYDEDGDPFEETSFYTIPWTSIKKIMAAIKARAALAAGGK